MPVIYDKLTQVPDWLNTSRPLTAQDLQGRVILVDFWTYCCINCLHVMPKLKELEHEFGDRLTVIGVHSAKFANESDTDNIRQAIQKYDIRHPVVNDADFLIWNNFGINAWPTLMLIGQDGMMKQVYRGEGDIVQMRNDIKDLLAKTGDKIVTVPLPIALERDKIPPTVLRFPTKLDAKDDHTLVIADSGHNRILVADIPSKKITQTIGSGISGFADGTLAKAQFDNPQGVLADGDDIFVADTGNHRLRRVDLKSGRVSTLAGTGERGDSVLFGARNAAHTALASPWDLAFYPDKSAIVIANAGSHQLWRYDRAKKTLALLAGNGRESLDDGALPFNSLSQPSGLSASGEKLYFVDAETSSLRVLQDGHITTLIGMGLFDFGLKDGKIDAALMQHAMGVYADTGGIYIADTYNHRIRKFAKGELSTLDIKGLKEPNDILKIGEVFYIADTNNHRIVMMDDDGDEKGVLDLMPQSISENASIPFQEHLPNVIDRGDQAVSPETMVQFDLPPKWHINQDAPSYLGLFDQDHIAVTQYKTADLQSGKIVLPVLQQDKTYVLQGIVYYCEDRKGSQCLIRGVKAVLNVSNPSMDQSAVTFTLPSQTKP